MEEGRGTNWSGQFAWAANMDSRVDSEEVGEGNSNERDALGTQ